MQPRSLYLPISIDVGGCGCGATAVGGRIRVDADVGTAALGHDENDDVDNSKSEILCILFGWKITLSPCRHHRRCVLRCWSPRVCDKLFQFRQNPRARRRTSTMRHEVNQTGAGAISITFYFRFLTTFLFGLQMFR